MMKLASVSVILAVLVIISLFGILADGTITYGVFRFIKLKTVPNILLANWAIAHMISAIILPLNVLMNVFLTISENHIANCLSIHATITSYLVALWFCIVLCIDWCSTAYFFPLSKKIREHYKFAISFIWLNAVPLYVTSAGSCVGYSTDLLPTVLVIISFIINLLFVLILHCSKLVQRFRVNPINYSRSLKVQLMMITTILCSYLVAIISSALALSDVYSITDNYLRAGVCLLLSISAIQGTPVIILGILYFLDRDFRRCLFPNHAHKSCDDLESENVNHNENLTSTATSSTSV
ncbi:hypothetical protein ILUMI_00094 [Ignelater luminosus]|uniref:G-protein coupled receptors family 1 profile domain-containing protein n=1 Tax=Ignelater luminosus TaxID=2038154 RepID=A0A8K0DH40_IGNLU|nr:hypothetical protein ILUMI_00094 [Ignelater luminosus]